MNTQFCLRFVCTGTIVNVINYLLLQFQPNKCVGHQVSLDYKGDDFTASLTTGNVDPLSSSGNFY